MRSAQPFCLVVGLVLLAVGLARLSVLHIATGLLLLAGAPAARPARLVCVAGFATYTVVAVVTWFDVFPIALALAALAAAAAPLPRARAAADNSVVGRAGAAYDASSAKQVFVGIRD